MAFEAKLWSSRTPLKVSTIFGSPSAYRDISRQGHPLVPGKSQPTFFQLTGKRFQLEDDRWTGLRCNQRVFIGRDFEADDLQQQLQDCLGSVLVSADP